MFPHVLWHALQDTNIKKNRDWNPGIGEKGRDFNPGIQNRSGLTPLAVTLI